MDAAGGLLLEAAIVVGELGNATFDATGGLLPMVVGGLGNAKLDVPGGLLLEAAAVEVVGGESSL